MKKFVMIFPNEDVEDSSVIIIKAENEQTAIKNGFNKIGWDLDNDQAFENAQALIDGGFNVLIKEVEEDDSDCVVATSFDFIDLQELELD